MTDTLHHLKIALDNVKPSVTREVIVASGLRLDQLHTVIQIAMGWTDSHMHEFIVGTLRDGEHYGTPVPDPLAFDLHTRNEKNVTLERIAPAKGSRFRYWYDFGDDWYHVVAVKAIIPATSGQQVPHCIKAARACPPEDCGGPWGYANLLEILADPEHEEHAEMHEWIGDDFDPEHVDVAAINADLAGLARHWNRASRKGTRASP